VLEELKDKAIRQRKPSMPMRGMEEKNWRRKREEEAGWTLLARITNSS
jgi:hypothetical protein